MLLSKNRKTRKRSKPYGAPAPYQLRIDQLEDRAFAGQIVPLVPALFGDVKESLLGVSSNTSRLALVPQSFGSSLASETETALAIDVAQGTFQIGFSAGVPADRASVSWQAQPYYPSSASQPVLSSDLLDELLADSFEPLGSPSSISASSGSRPLDDAPLRTVAEGGSVPSSPSHGAIRPLRLDSGSEAALQLASLGFTVGFGAGDGQGPGRGGGAFGPNGGKKGGGGGVGIQSLPSVFVSTQQSGAEANRVPVIFKFGIQSPPFDGVTIYYHEDHDPPPPQSTATAGVDYTPVPPGVITIPAGQQFAYLELTPVDDLLVEGAETIWIVIDPRPTYTISVGQASGGIIDNDVAGPAVPVDAYVPDD